MIDPREVEALANYCKSKLDLTNLQLPEEYGYPNLLLCIIDAVFSIGVTYSSTRNTVNRFTAYVHDKHGPDFVMPISDFCQLHSENPIEHVAKTIYQNSQRTSSKNGILKAEAVWRVAQLLQSLGVESLADIEKFVGKEEFETPFQQIPGQKSGVSLRYLYMLLGSETEIKPDRMVIRFLTNALNRSVRMEECHSLVLEACQILTSEFPDLKPRTLDHFIWQFQSAQK
jgi:hypothetical protein